MSRSLYEVKAAINELVLQDYKRVDEAAAKWQAVVPSLVGILAAVGAVAPVELGPSALYGPGLKAYYDDAGQELAIMQAVDDWAGGADFALIWHSCSESDVFTHFADLRGCDDCQGQYFTVAVMPAREVCGHGI